MRKIIHIDMDAFFASVEQRDNPDLIGKPVAVGRSSERGVVAAASYEARKYGVRSAMPSVTAKRKCPDLVFVPHRMDVYKSVSNQIRAVFNRFTDLVEPLSLDEAYLDVTQNKPGLPSATEVAQAIKNEIFDVTGLTASAGVSYNKFLAKIASDMDKPDGMFVIRPQQAQQFIDELPIEKFFGIGKVTAQKMRKHGIRKGADLKSFPLAQLVHHFGKAGQYFHEVAHGQDNRPVVASRIRKSIGAERTFAQDLTVLDEMLASLSEIAEEVSRRMAAGNRVGRTVTIKIKFADFHQITRSQSLLQPVGHADLINRIAAKLMSGVYAPGMHVRLLGITLSNLQKPDSASSQLTLGL